MRAWLYAFSAALPVILVLVSLAATDLADVAAGQRGPSGAASLARESAPTRTSPP